MSNDAAQALIKDTLSHFHIRIVLHVFSVPVLHTEKMSYTGVEERAHSLAQEMKNSECINRGLVHKSPFKE